MANRAAVITIICIHFLNGNLLAICHGELLQYWDKTSTSCLFEHNGTSLKKEKQKLRPTSSNFGQRNTLTQPQVSIPAICQGFFLDLNTSANPKFP